MDENIHLMGQLKGMSEEEIEEKMISLKTLLFLEPHSSKQAKNLSGGNKRKLC